MYRFTLSLTTLALFLCAPLVAATFKPLKQMKSTAARNLETVAIEVAKHKTTFGDSSFVNAYSFSRDADEADLNTIKQLNSKKGGLNSDDVRAQEMQNLDAGKLAEHLLAANSQPDDQDVYNNSLKSLTAALKKVKDDPSLQILGATHADEDGSWQILDILDVGSKEVLFIKIGFFGT